MVSGEGTPVCFPDLCQNTAGPCQEPAPTLGVCNDNIPLLVNYPVKTLNIICKHCLIAFI